MKEIEVICPNCNGKGYKEENGHGAFGESETRRYECTCCKGKCNVLAKKVKKKYRILDED